MGHPAAHLTLVRPNHDETMLIIFGGLPGVGKTTLAKAAAREWEAVYLRVDTIEQALRFSETLQGEVGPAGYLVGASANNPPIRPVFRRRVSGYRLSSPVSRPASRHSGRSPPGIKRLPTTGGLLRSCMRCGICRSARFVLI
jgi:hypothetical protein